MRLAAAHYYITIPYYISNIQVRLAAANYYITIPYYITNIQVRLAAANYYIPILYYITNIQVRLAAANYPGELEELLREGGGRAATLLLGEVSRVLRLVAECHVAKCQLAHC